MGLPSVDDEYLRDRGLTFEVTAEQGLICVLITTYELPAGYNAPDADLMLRLNPGYPDVPPDMWWFSPSIHRVDGQTIPATEVVEMHVGRQWQRWSRHLSAGQWQSGIDGIESYLALIRRELERCSGVQAATCP